MAHLVPMADKRSPLALGSPQGRSKPLNASRLLNLYPEPAPKGSTTDWVLYGTPGQSAFATVGSGTIRAGHEALGYCYVLSGATLYRVDAAGNATICTGATIPSGGNVFMTDNGVQLGLLAANQLFYLTTSANTTVTRVTDADYPAEGATSLDYLDGYGILSRAGNSGQWFTTDLLDFSSITAANFATAESSPDALYRVLALHKEAWLFGSQTTEVWQDTGASPFPFEQIPGSLMNRGIGAPLSALTMDNSVIWLGDDKIVYRADGYTPMRISTFAVEEVLRSGTVSDAYAMTHALGGHHFYILTLPTLGRTLAYDAATQIWHERQSTTSLTPQAWNVNCLFPAFGRILGGGSSGVVFELDLNTFTEANGGQIRRSVTSLPVYPDGKRGTMRFVEMECELGVGAANGQGSNPQVMLRFSRDGGQTFGNEKWTTFGATGARRARARWNQLGAFRDGVVELSIADPVKVCIYGARFIAEGHSE